MQTTVHARVADMKTEVILCCADLPFSRMLTLELERLHLGVRHYAMLPDRLQELMRRAGLLIVDAELSDAHLSDALALADRAALPVILFGWQLAAPQNTVSGQDRVVLMRRPFLMERFLLAVRSAFSAQIESDVFGVNRSKSSLPRWSGCALIRKKRAALCFLTRMQFCSRGGNTISCAFFGKIAASRKAAKRFCMPSGAIKKRIPALLRFIFAICGQKSMMYTGCI